MKEILPCLKVRTKDSPHLHGWIYEDWLKEIDDDPFDEEFAAFVTTGAPRLVNIVDESIPSEPNSEVPEDGNSINPRADGSIHHTPFGFLQMFPPAEEEMAWVNSTQLRHLLC